MVNRYLLIGRFPLVITIIMGILVGNVLLNHGSTAFPAQKRPYSLVDRLIRANPLRSLVNLFRRNLSADLYYPPYQQVHPFMPMPMRMPSNPVMATPTHYVKMPVYFMPISSVAMMSPQPNSVFHGFSYPVETPASRYFIKPTVSTYHEPVPLAPSNYQKNNSLGQTAQINYLSISASAGPTISVSPSSSQMEFPPALIHSDYGNRDQVISNFVNNSDKESSSQEAVQLHVPPQYEHHTVDDVSPAVNSESVKIVVIRPSDLQNMKNMEAELARGAEISAPTPDMVKGYTMKYVEMGDGDNGNPTPEFLFDSENVQLAPIGGDTSEGGSDCEEPMCDPFLRKLIPELLASSSFRRNQVSSENEDEPIVIVKSDNDTVIPVDYSVAFLNQNYGPSETQNEQVSLVQPMEENKPDIIQSEHYSYNNRPKRVHFPRRKLISAKINSTSLLEKYESKRRTQESRPTVLKMHKKLHNFANNHRLKSIISANHPTPSPDDEEVIPKPRIFEVEKSRSHPYYRYGSKTPKHLSRMTRRANKLKRTGHYTAGIVFNEELKAVNPTV